MDSGLAGLCIHAFRIAWHVNIDDLVGAYFAIQESAAIFRYSNQRPVL